MARHTNKQTGRVDTKQESDTVKALRAAIAEHKAAGNEADASRLEEELAKELAKG